MRILTDRYDIYNYINKTSQLINDIGFITEGLTYINNIVYGEYYSTSSGLISSDNSYTRTSKFATLGKFVATFTWTATSAGTLTAHAWDSKGNYKGSASAEIESGSTGKEWSLIPSEGDAYYAFDMSNVSNVSVNITYTYAQLSDIPTNVSLLTNDSDYVNTTTLNTSISKKADNVRVEDITETVFINSGSCILEPNIYYIVTELAIIDITLQTPSDTTIANEYMMEFTTPTNGCSLIVPGTIKWSNGTAPTIEGGKTYQLSIINNNALWAVFE